jgi:flagellar basal body rod protein FlgG
MSVDAEMLRLIADNIANAQTPGYQRKVGVQRTEFALPTESSVDQAINAVFDSVTGSIGPAVPGKLSIATDTSPGTLVQTREPLDIALNGAGALIASTSTGEVNIRGGKLQIDAHGTLVTLAGDPVLGIAGPISFTGKAINHSDIDISADGIVKLSGDVVGQLRIQAADVPQGSAQEPVVPRVMQGFVEQSNVDSVTELLKMMEVLRHFEANQKALRNYDGLLQQAIGDLGKI